MLIRESYCTHFSISTTLTGEKMDTTFTLSSWIRNMRHLTHSPYPLFLKKKLKNDIDNSAVEISSPQSSLQEERPKLLRWLVGLAKDFKRPAVRHAYVGEANRYFYVNEAHAWVLHQDRDMARIREASDMEQAGFFFNEDLNMTFDGEVNEEEELTVMAIQAAQLARTSGKDTNDNLLESPRNVCSSSSEEGWADLNTSEYNNLPVEEKVVPWLAFLSRRSHMSDMAPSLASVWHLVLIATQTIVPAWLLFPYEGGGLGWRTREVTLVLLMMGGGMALIRASIASHLTSKSMERYGPKRISVALLIHVITVIPLCIFSTVLSKK